MKKRIFLVLNLIVMGLCLTSCDAIIDFLDKDGDVEYYEPSLTPTDIPSITPTPSIEPSVSPSIPDENPSINEGEAIVESIVYDDFQMHFLELGNEYAGDCTYIKAGENDILIDAGSRKGSAATIKSYVDQYCTDGVLEYVIATHAHQDHIAGFVGNSSGSTRTGILYQYDVEMIIDYPLSDATSQISKDYKTAVDLCVQNGAINYNAAQCFNEEDGAKATYSLGEGMSFTILYNYYYFNSAKGTEGEENNYSVCTLFTYNDLNFLLTGDLEQEGEEYMASYYDSSTEEKTLPHCVLFKSGHHGSKTSSNECLLELITPDICTVCCCAGSTEYTANYNNIFPTQDFITRIAKYTDQVYVTSLLDTKESREKEEQVFKSFNGNIIISCDGTQIGIAASNNLIKLKDSEWFNEQIAVKVDSKNRNTICSGTKKKDYYLSTDENVVMVPRRVWPTN